MHKEECINMRLEEELILVCLINGYIWMYILITKIAGYNITALTQYVSMQ